MLIDHTDKLYFMTEQPKHFEGENLSGASLRNRDLSNSTFTDCYLANANLSNTNLRASKWINVTLFEADFSGSDLSAAAPVRVE
jgi:uncharacterized protein YjbI with pentapeptide repeats